MAKKISKKRARSPETKQAVVNSNKQARPMFGQLWTQAADGKKVLTPPVLHPTEKEAKTEALKGFRPERVASGSIRKVRTPMFPHVATI